MMRRSTPWLGLLAAGWLVIAEPARAQPDTPAPCTARGVRVMVVPFAEPTGRGDDLRLSAVGRNVSAVLTLQVLLRLRAGRGLGQGTAVWEPRIREPITSHRAAAEVARGRAHPPQLVLWGTVSTFGEWLVIQPRLTVVPDTQLLARSELCTRERTEVWRAPKIPSGLEGLSLGLPSLAYDFDPISLPRAVTDRFADPAGLTLYRAYRRGRLSLPMGKMGAELRALEQGKTAVKVRADGRVGWIETTGLSGGNAMLELVDGLIRIMRGDFVRATAPLARVSGDEATALAIRVDALLLQGLAWAHYGKPRRGVLDAAAALDPHGVEVARAQIVGRVAEWWAKAAGRGPRPALPAELAAFIEARSYLFAPDDPLRAVLELP